MNNCIRAAGMKPFAVALGLAFTFGSGSVAAAPPQKSVAAAPLQLYDSQGKAFGRMLNEYTVVTTVSGSATAVDLLSPQEISPTADLNTVPVYFSGPDCTGQAYIYEYYARPVKGMGVALVTTDAAGRRYLYPTAGSRLTAPLSIQSQFAGGCSAFNWPDAYYLIPAGAPVDISGFVPPFQIK